MFAVYECVAHQHDLVVVALAAICWLIGSFALFFLLQRSRECAGHRWSQWTALAAVAGGVSVWTTHFVAMLAYRGIMPISFDGALTGLSTLLCVAFFVAALRALGRGPSQMRSSIAGLIATLGVAVMHFTGMAAVIAPAHIEYDWSTVAIAAAISWAGFSGAFFLFNHLTGWRRVIAPPIGAQVAVFALHFMAMSATRFIPDGTTVPTAGMVGSQWLVGATLAGTAMVVILIAIGAVLDRLLTDLQGFADATFEGLAIVRDGRIIEANAQFCRMAGGVLDDVIGSSPGDWLDNVDANFAEGGTAASLETCPTNGNGHQTFEVATKLIEYRGRDCVVLAVRDLSDKKRATQEIEFLARHDVLTSLPNRGYFENRLRQALSTGDRQVEYALLALDLDRFKAVNDVFGHAVGDDVLRKVARILTSVVRSRDVVARIGGDEFLILQNDGPQPVAAKELTRRILDAFAAEMDVAMNPMAVGVSIGVALCPRDGNSAEVLRHNADIALYRAKENGRGNACFFDGSMDAKVRERRELEQDLRQAIVRNELSLAYQPLVATDTGKLAGYEALLRWRHPVRGDVAPSDFIPIAEDIGIILQMGDWVLRHACRDAMAWPDDLTLAVNVSPVQFQLTNLAAVVRGALSDTGFDPRRLELEITEGVLLRDKEATLQILHEIKDMGVRIAMDDFGTGYSSLSNLRSFPFDKIKLDKSFVSGTDDAARSIVRAVVGLGQSLGLPVVAEGVETEEQRVMVAEEGCPQAQGYLFGSPVPVSDRRAAGEKAA